MIRWHNVRTCQPGRYIVSEKHESLGMMPYAAVPAVTECSESENMRAWP